MTEEEKPKRKRGAPKGNHNARKHGFYSKFLDPEGSQKLQRADGLHGLEQKIALMRVKIASLLSNDPRNYEVFLLAVSTLARLLRTMQHLGALQIKTKNNSRSV